MEALQNKLRETVRGLFKEDRIDIFIGYQRATIGRQARPCIIESADETDRLVWDRFCANNLAVYLPSLYPKDPRPPKDGPPPRIRAGIAVMGCSMRSIVGLVKEHQVRREDIVVVGMPCQGMTDSDEELLEACGACCCPVPEGVDIVIDGESRAPAAADYPAVKAFEQRPAPERWQYFEETISKCVRCYACRQACPNCYCKECFADQTQPQWMGVSTELSDTMMYHIGRVFHQAGRCVSCGACQRACPMGIDIGTFTAKIVKDVEDQFGFVPGFDLDAAPPLTVFEMDDKQDFITEP